MGLERSLSGEDVDSTKYGKITKETRPTPDPKLLQSEKTFLEWETHHPKDNATPNNWAVGKMLVGLWRIIRNPLN